MNVLQGVMLRWPKNVAENPDNVVLFPPASGRKRHLGLTHGLISRLRTSVY
jgi:hypothetical protein